MATKRAPRIGDILETVLYLRAIDASDVEVRAILRRARTLAKGRNDNEAVTTAITEAVRRFERRQAGISEDMSDAAALDLFEKYHRRKAKQFEARAKDAFATGDADAGKAWMRSAEESGRLAIPWRTLRWDVAKKDYA